MGTEIKEAEIGNFEEYPSKTHKVRVGCDAIYITILFKDHTIFKVILHHNKDLKCSRTMFDDLNKQTTFQTRRDLNQTIKDLIKPNEQYACEECNIFVKRAIKQNKLAGYTCGDAMARVLLKERDK